MLARNTTESDLPLAQDATAERERCYSSSITRGNTLVQFTDDA